MRKAGKWTKGGGHLTNSTADGICVYLTYRVC